MASVSFSRPLWHPDRVFNVFPNDPQSTCVGIASSTGRRCRWPLYSDEQFSASRRAAAVELLRSMSEMHPSEITRAQLYSLAQNTLCRDFHLQKQADRTEFEWTAILDRYVIEHGEMISVRQQLAALQPNARTQDDSQNTKVEYVKAQMEVGCANCEKYEATSSKEVKAQLDIMTTTEITRLETMIRETNEKLDESAKISKEKADDLRQLLVDRHFLQSREQDKKFEQLANAIGGVGQKMTQEMDWVKQELREQVEGLKQEHTKQTNGVKQELRKEIDGLKQEHTKQMNGVKQELRKEIDGLKQEHTKQVNGVKKELRQEIDGLKQEQAKQMDGVKQELRKEIDGLKQELTKREEDYSLVQPQKRGFVAKMLEQRPRVLVRETSSLMTPESTP